MRHHSRRHQNDTSHSIDISEKAGVRYLHFGSDWVQGAMRVNRPHALELAYTREMMAGLLLREDPWPRHALIVGLGAGSLLRFLWKHCPETAITVIEINPEVIQVARHAFGLPDDPGRIELIVADGADYMAHCTQAFDAILIDGYDHQARAGGLDTLPFYADCRSRLEADGLAAFNLFGRSRGYEASVGRVMAAFDEHALAFPSCDSGNAIVFASPGPATGISIDSLRERAATLKTRTGLDLAPTISRLEASGRLPGGLLGW